MKILIVGAGAVGGFYGAKLAAAGEEVTFLARGQTLSVLQKGSLSIQSYQGNFDVRDFSPPDVIIICVKTYDTDTVLEQIAPAVGKETILLSLQNGVESETKMAACFGAEKVLGAVCYIGAEMTEPGIVQHSADGQVAIGELDGSETARLQDLYEMMKKAGIDVSLSKNIRKASWGKLLWNVPFNQLCAIARASVGEILDSAAMRELLQTTGREVVCIAQQNGIDLTAADVEKHLAFSEKELRPVRPSMLQDLEKGKRLEHETIAGFILREGKRLKVPVPINETLYRLLAFLDQPSNLKDIKPI